MKKEWYVDWFGSHFYHTLYQNRNEEEAGKALDNLLQALDLPPGARILDLACGRGRHSRYLAAKGFDVTGLDMSYSSIGYARRYEHERLAFYQHDMRFPFRINYFDAVMNMFTSFGYFEDDRDHLLAMRNIRQGLKHGGLLLLDFFNTEWVRKQLVPAEDKTVDGITFHLSREIQGEHVFKTIAFAANGRDYEFRERVKLLTLEDFKRLFADAGLELTRTFGGYDLAPYDPAASKRLILIAQKPV